MPTEEEIAQAKQATTPATTGDATGDAKAKTDEAKADEKRFTQAELDALIKDRLDRERKQVEEKQKTATADAEKAKLKEQGQLKELSEKQAGELLTLTTEKETLSSQVTTLQAQVTAYEAAFAKQLTEQKKALPEPVQKLLDKMPLLDQSTWIVENSAKLGVIVKGVPATPRADGGNSNAKEDEAAKQAADRRYNNF